MKKWKCMNIECKNYCELRSDVKPVMCVENPFNPHGWQEMGETNQLPKLTADVFNRPDCPEWARYAAVDADGYAYWYREQPYIHEVYDDDGDYEGYWEISDGFDENIPGKWDAEEWEYSIVKKYAGKLEVRFKKLDPEAKAPYQATPGSAGFDLTAVSSENVEDSWHIRYGTGLAVEIPAGHVGLVFPRSSVYKTKLLLSNGVGVIDSDYRGEITAVFAKGSGDEYKVGDRIAQLVIMPIPAVKFVEAEELSETERGAGGYGSTGR